MAVASKEPTPLSNDDASFSRKLLILDLNGTLVHRAAPNQPRNRPKHKGPDGTASNQDAVEPLVDSAGRPLPRLRPVHPRPYMGAFRSYLFASETQQWLDVMIWSSAQPYSVNDMVSKTFGDERDKLVAIWARDTFGLSNENYGMSVTLNGLRYVDRCSCGESYSS